MKTIYMRETSAQYFRYHRATNAAGGQICTPENPLVCDALLLPGGGDLLPQYYGQPNLTSYALDPERDRAERELLDRFLTAGKPILGICRGLQLINVYFGGTLLQDIPGHNCTDGMDRIHKAKTTGLLLPICGEVCLVNSAHHQAVDRIGSALIPLQWAPDGTIEALCHRSIPLLAVQWHPERLPLPHGQRLFQWFLSQYL